MRRSRIVSLIVLVVAMATLPVAAREWEGRGHVAGRVLDPDGRPVSGATVLLQRLDSGDGPPATETDADGRWSLSRLSPGTWRLRVEAAGFVPADGRVRIPASGAARPVEIRLRSQGVVSPPGSEGDPDAVRRSLDTANAHLEAGRYAEARAEYERVLGELPRSEQAPILSSIARCRYLEGAPDEALATLQRALAIAPQDAALRRVTLELYSVLGRREEGETYLRDLAASPPAPPAVEPEDDVSGRAWPERPTLPPEPHRTGRYRIAFEGSSPIATLEEYARRHEVTPERIRSEDPGAGAYRIANETFEVYVPGSYSPDVPHGVLVWISPGPFGGVERPENLEVLDRHRLIWVGANRAGNDRFRWDRALLAVEAARQVAALYTVDPDRIRVGGYSGGGRVASDVAMLYPDVFGGGLFVMGCDYFRGLPIPDRPGALYPAAFPRPPRGTLRDLRRDHRFVLVTGERDFNRAQTRVIAEAMRDDGFDQVTMIELPGADHYTPLPAEVWDRAFAALESPTVEVD